MRTSRPVTVTLGKQQASLEARLSSGTFSSASEVMRAALRALDREDAALDAIMRTRIDEALADPRPSIPAKAVFAELRQHAAKRDG